MLAGARAGEVDDVKAKVDLVGVDAMLPGRNTSARIVHLTAKPGREYKGIVGSAGIRGEIVLAAIDYVGSNQHASTVTERLLG